MNHHTLVIKNKSPAAAAAKPRAITKASIPLKMLASDSPNVEKAVIIPLLEKKINRSFSKLSIRIF